MLRVDAQFENLKISLTCINENGPWIVITLYHKIIQNGP